MLTNVNRHNQNVMFIILFLNHFLAAVPLLFNAMLLNFRHKNAILIMLTLYLNINLFNLKIPIISLWPDAKLNSLQIKHPTQQFTAGASISAGT